MGREALSAEIFYRSARRLAGAVECTDAYLAPRCRFEFDSIEDPDVRAPLEERSLRLGRDLVLNRRTITDIDSVLDMARARQTGEMA